MAREYAILQANYNKNENIMKQRQIVCDDFHKKYKSTKSIPSENCLILWNNVDLPLEMGHTTELLLGLFASELIARNKTDGVKLYIPDPLVLTEGKQDAALLLRRMTLLYKNAEVIPYFLENDFLFIAAISDLSNVEQENLAEYEASHSRWSKYIQSGESDFYLQKEEHIFYERMFTVLSNMFLAFEGDNALNKDEGSFICQYLNWQCGVSITDCLDKLDTVSRSTFYRYATQFETTPYYCEYYYSNRLRLMDEAKRGDLYISSIMAFEITYRDWCVANRIEGELSKFLNSPFAILDVDRIHLACLNKLNTLFQKTQLQQKLEEEHINQKDAEYILDEVTKFRKILRQSKKKTAD